MKLKTCHDIAREFAIDQDCNIEDHGFFYEQDLLYTQHFDDEIWRVCRNIVRSLKERKIEIKWEYKN